MEKSRQIKLSPTKLSLFLECPRCFWLSINKKIERPEIPSSTLPRGMDHTIKNYYDKFRVEGLPPELKGLVPGRLLSSEEEIKKMRSSLKFQMSDTVSFEGKLDEALELNDGTIVPLDNKTRGYPLKEIHWTIKKQMNGYSLLLRENGYKTKNEAYIIYWYLDHKNMDFKHPLKFFVSIEKIDTYPDITKQEIINAIETLKGDIPKLGIVVGEKGEELCNYCEYYSKLNKIVI